MSTLPASWIPFGVPGGSSRVARPQSPQVSNWQRSMILSGSEIRAQLGSNIQIDPFNEDQLNSNSYNLRLHDELLVYEEIVLDMRKPSRFGRLQIPPEGLVLQPNQLYLGRTIEHTETHNYVPMLEGRSSIGRLGLFVHVTAGFGDVGFCGYWTLEMFAVQPVRIYAGVQVCQIFYHSLEGDVTEYKSGKYQNNTDIQPSLLFRELGNRDERQMKLNFNGSRPDAVIDEHTADELVRAES
ncbi:MAG: dCTP deaminase [Planctomycetaceae bacterium]